MGERPSITPPAGGTIDHRFRSDATQSAGQSGPYIERISITNNANAIQLARGLPPRCRVKWVCVKNATAVTLPDGGATGTADGFALVKVAAVSSIDETTSTEIMASVTTLTANGTVRADPMSAANQSLFSNTGTTEAALWLIPIDSGGGQYFETATDAGYLFSGTASVDVMIDVEQYRDLDDA